MLGSVFIVFSQLQPELGAPQQLKLSSSDHSTAMSNSLNGGWQEGNMSRKLNQSFPAGQQPSSFFESPLWCGLADRLGRGGGWNCERSVCRCEQESVTKMQADTFALAAFKTKETPN